MVKPTDSDAGLNGGEQPKLEENTDYKNDIKDNSNLNIVRADTQVVKLPQFMPSDPKLWFDLIEIIFETQKITEQKSKYANVIMAMETELILEIEDIFKSTKAKCDYDVLKSKILERYKEIKEEDTRIMVSDMKLDHRIPSLFLECLQNVAKNILPEEELREWFIQSLPKDVQEPLGDLISLEVSMPLEKIAKQADILMDFYSKLTN